MYLFTLGSTITAKNTTKTPSSDTGLLLKIHYNYEAKEWHVKRKLELSFYI